MKTNFPFGSKVKWKMFKHKDNWLLYRHSNQNFDFHMPADIGLHQEVIFSRKATEILHYIGKRSHIQIVDGHTQSIFRKLSLVKQFFFRRGTRGCQSVFPGRYVERRKKKLRSISGRARAAYLRVQRDFTVYTAGQRAHSESRGFSVAVKSSRLVRKLRRLWPPLSRQPPWQLRRDQRGDKWFRRLAHWRWPVYYWPSD